MQSRAERYFVCSPDLCPGIVTGPVATILFVYLVKATGNQGSIMGLEIHMGPGKSSPVPSKYIAEVPYG